MEDKLIFFELVPANEILMGKLTKLYEAIKFGELIKKTGILDK